MGNQSSKKQETEVQPIKQVVVEMRQVTSKEESFVMEIQNQNQKNVNQRKSVAPPPDQNVAPVSSTNVAPRLSKKQLSKKELPPLKLRNSTSMKSTPLGNCQSVTNQASNGVQELQEVQCEKGQKPTDNNAADMDEKELEDQKQNNEAVMNARTKKFRPSQTSAKKHTLPSSALINDVRQATELGQIIAA